MAYITRIKYTAEQKAEMRDRRQRGESQKAIGRVFNRAFSSIVYLLAPTGDFRPPPHRRSRTTLTLAEWEEVYRGVARHLS